MIAAGAGLVTWLAFLVLDKRKNRPSSDSEGIIEKHQPPEVEPSSSRSSTSRVIDYTRYHLNKQEYIVSVVGAAAVFGAIGHIFYKQPIMVILLAGLGFLYPRIRRKELLSKRKRELTTQFKQALYTLSSSLAAGRSVSNSFVEVAKDLRLLYPNPDTYIIKEFQLINQRVSNGDPIELPLQDFSERAGVEDITNFTDVFITCQRQGGDLVDVIRRTSTIIGEKIEIEQEISVLISSKRLESRILSVAPFAFVGFMSSTSPDYMAPLFGGTGYIVMTVSLLVLTGSFFITKRIMNIKV